MSEYELFELTSKQQRAFNRLKKAYKDCEAEGIYFYNMYGRLSAVDSKLIEDYGDKTSGFPEEMQLVDNNVDSAHSLEIPGEWSDDTHIFLLTKKAMKILNE